MRRKSISSVSKRLVYLITGMIVFFSSRCTAYAEFNRYDSLPAPTAVSTTSGIEEESAVQETKEEIDTREFNSTFLDTVIYIIGGLAGFIMILQISGYCICRIFPSWNEKVAKLKFLGITGYEDSILSFSVKIGLLGITSYLCLSGMIKRLIGWVFGMITNLIN